MSGYKLNRLGDLPADVYPPDNLQLPSRAPRSERVADKIPVYVNGRARQFAKIIPASSLRVLKANEDRIALEFFNISANIIRVNYAGAAGASSIPIPPIAGGVAGYYSPPIAPVDDIFAIAAIAGSELIIVEYVKTRSNF
jgi:hypothetical protein